MICEFDMSSGGERNLDDDDDVVLSLAFSGRVLEKLFLFVDVKDKLGQILTISCYRGSDE